MPLTDTNFRALNYLLLSWPLLVMTTARGERTKGAVLTQLAVPTLDISNLQDAFFFFRSTIHSPLRLRCGLVRFTVKLLLTVFSYSPLIFSGKWLLLPSPPLNCSY